MTCLLFEIELLKIASGDVGDVCGERLKKFL